jgi:AraC family transcriptional regulator
MPAGPSRDRPEGDAYFGRPLRELSLGGVRLVEKRHSAGEVLPWHEHQRGYWTLVARGSYREETSGRATTCTEGLLVAHPPGEAHRDVFGREGAELLAVEIREPQGELGAARAAVARRVELRRPVVTSLAARLRAELRAPDEVSGLAVSGLVLELAAHVLREGAPPARLPAWLREADRIVRERFLEPLTLSALAGEVGVHPHHLARAHREAFGASVGERLRELRVAYGQQLLAGSLPLAEVALRAGFSDQSHFTRCFTRCVGVTPGSYRRARLGGAARPLSF